MTTLVWLFFGMSILISSFVTVKITSWNVKRKFTKKLNTPQKGN